MGEFLYNDETQKIIGIAFQVRNELGTGWSEEIYHKALVYYLLKHNIPTRSKPRQPFIHKGVTVHTFEPDIIVYDKIILELKVLRTHKKKSFPQAHQTQLLHYLKFNQMSIGLLFNFANSKVGVRRMIFEEQDFQIAQDYQSMLPFVTERDKQILRRLQQIILRIGASYGLGYPETVYRQLISIELTEAGINHICDLQIPVYFDEHSIGTQFSRCILIENKFLINVKSQFKVIPTAEYLGTKSYLKALDLYVGWVVLFGIDQLEIKAVLPDKKSHG